MGLLNLLPTIQWTEEATKAFKALIDDLQKLLLDTVDKDNIGHKQISVFIEIISKLLNKPDIYLAASNVLNPQIYAPLIKDLDVIDGGNATFTPRFYFSKPEQNKLTKSLTERLARFLQEFCLPDKTGQGLERQIQLSTGEGKITNGARFALKMALEQLKFINNIKFIIACIELSLALLEFYQTLCNVEKIIELEQQIETLYKQNQISQDYSKQVKDIIADLEATKLAYRSVHNLYEFWDNIYQSSEFYAENSYACDMKPALIGLAKGTGISVFSALKKLLGEEREYNERAIILKGQPVSSMRITLAETWNVNSEESYENIVKTFNGLISKCHEEATKYSGNKDKKEYLIELKNNTHSIPEITNIKDVIFGLFTVEYEIIMRELQNSPSILSQVQSDKLKKYLGNVKSILLLQESAFASELATLESFSNQKFIDSDEFIAFTKNLQCRFNISQIILAAFNEANAAIVKMYRLNAVKGKGPGETGENLAVLLKELIKLFSKIKHTNDPMILVEIAKNQAIEERIKLSLIEVNQAICDGDLEKVQKLLNDNPELTSLEESTQNFYEYASEQFPSLRPISKSLGDSESENSVEQQSNFEPSVINENSKTSQQDVKTLGELVSLVTVDEQITRELDEGDMSKIPPSSGTMFLKENYAGGLETETKSAARGAAQQIVLNSIVDSSQETESSLKEKENADKGTEILQPETALLEEVKLDSNIVTETESITSEQEIEALEKTERELKEGDHTPTELTSDEEDFSTFDNEYSDLELTSTKNSEDSLAPIENVCTREEIVLVHTEVISLKDNQFENDNGEIDGGTTNAAITVMSTYHKLEEHFLKGTKIKDESRSDNRAITEALSDISADVSTPQFESKAHSKKDDTAIPKHTSEITSDQIIDNSTIEIDTLQLKVVSLKVKIERLDKKIKDHLLELKNYELKEYSDYYLQNLIFNLDLKLFALENLQNMQTDKKGKLNILLELTKIEPADPDTFNWLIRELDISRIEWHIAVDKLKELESENIFAKEPIGYKNLLGKDSALDDFINLIPFISKTSSRTKTAGILIPLARSVNDKISIKIKQVQEQKNKLQELLNEKVKLNKQLAVVKKQFSSVQSNVSAFPSPIIRRSCSYSTGMNFKDLLNIEKNNLKNQEKPIDEELNDYDEKINQTLKSNSFTSFEQLSQTLQENFKKLPEYYVSKKYDGIKTVAANIHDFALTLIYKGKQLNLYDRKYQAAKKYSEKLAISKKQRSLKETVNESKIALKAYFDQLTYILGISVLKIEEFAFNESKELYKEARDRFIGFLDLPLINVFKCLSEEFPQDDFIKSSDIQELANFFARAEKYCFESEEVACELKYK